MANEPPARLLLPLAEVIGETVDVAIEAHEHRQHCHQLPPPNDDPITHIPYAEVTVDDDTMSHAIELGRELDERTVAEILDIPYEALQLALANYQRRYGKLITIRARVR